MRKNSNIIQEKEKKPKKISISKKKKKQKIIKNYKSIWPNKWSPFNLSTQMRNF